MLATVLHKRLCCSKTTTDLGKQFTIIVCTTRGTVYISKYYWRWNKILSCSRCDQFGYIAICAYHNSEISHKKQILDSNKNLEVREWKFKYQKIAPRISIWWWIPVNYMCEISGDNISDDILKSLCISQLPERILAASGEKLDCLAKMCIKINKIVLSNIWESN